MWWKDKTQIRSAEPLIVQLFIGGREATIFYFMVEIVLRDDDDVFIYDVDDDDDDDEWTLCFMSSDEEDMTKLIQNGIKRISDGIIDEDTDDDDDFVAK